MWERCPFFVAVAYTTFVHHLFNLRFVLRENLAYDLMVFALSAYSSIIFLITQSLTDGTDKIKQFAVLVFAFSFYPLRRLLEEKTDWLLFGAREGREEPRKRRRGRGR